MEFSIKAENKGKGKVEHVTFFHIFSISLASSSSPLLDNIPSGEIPDIISKHLKPTYIHIQVLELGQIVTGGSKKKYLDIYIFVIVMFSNNSYAFSVKNMLT